jgi:hypothetical protein
MNFRRDAWAVTIVAASLSLAACSADVNPTRDVLVAVGAGGVPAPAPDFVRTSRPEALDYVPVGSAKAERATPARKPEEAKAIEAELDALRARKEAEGAALRSEAAASPSPKVPAASPSPKVPAAAKKAASTP